MAPDRERNWRGWSWSDRRGLARDAFSVLHRSFPYAHAALFSFVESAVMTGNAFGVLGTTALADVLHANGCPLHQIILRSMWVHFR